MDLPPGTAAADVGKFDGRYTLTVGALNAKLDELVLVGGGRGAAPAAAEQAAERRGEKGGQAVAGRKAAVLAELMQLTTPRQMRWIVQIILGNPKARLQKWTVSPMCFGVRAAVACQPGGHHLPPV